MYPTKESPQQVPPCHPSQWGVDELTGFMKTSEENGFATFERLKPEFEPLVGINKLFHLAHDCMTNAEKWFSCLFILKSHSAYMGACRLVIAGQIPEGFQVLRGALESSLYGFFIAQHPEMKEVWLRRDESETHRRKVRDEFKPKRIIGEMKAADQKAGDAADRMYEELIDYGAHPNEKGMSLRLEILSDEQIREFRIKMLNPKPEYLVFGMRTVARVGLVCIRIFGLIEPHRYKLSGLDQEWQKLAKGY